MSSNFLKVQRPWIVCMYVVGKISSKATAADTKDQIANKNPYSNHGKHEPSEGRFIRSNQIIEICKVYEAVC